jgi:hypothetical protein
MLRKLASQRALVSARTHGVAPTVDRDASTGDVGRLVGGEEGYRFGYFLGLAGPAERVRRFALFEELRRVGRTRYYLVIRESLKVGAN